MSIESSKKVQDVLSLTDAEKMVIFQKNWQKRQAEVKAWEKTAAGIDVQPDEKAGTSENIWKKANINLLIKEDTVFKLEGLIALMKSSSTVNLNGIKPDTEVEILLKMFAGVIIPESMSISFETGFWVSAMMMRLAYSWGEIIISMPDWLAWIAQVVTFDCLNKRGEIDAANLLDNMERFAPIYVTRRIWNNSHPEVSTCSTYDTAEWALCELCSVLARSFVYLSNSAS